MRTLLYLFGRSATTFATSAALATAGGVAIAALIFVISAGINDVTRLPELAPVYFALCLAGLAAKVGAELAVLRATQGVAYDMRIDMCNRILLTPLRKLESLGKERVLGIVTNDLDALTQAMQLLPTTFSNSVAILSCMAYLAWLSWQVFIVLLAFLAIGSVGYYLAEQRPLRQLSKVRDQMEVVNRHFFELIEGSKELQLNASRAQVFVRNVLTPSAETFRNMVSRTLGGYIWVANLGAMLLYLLIGIFLFAVPAFFPQHQALLIGVTLVLLFLVRPISDLMISLPVLRQVPIALAKIERLSKGLAASGEATAHEPLVEVQRDSGQLIELRGIRHCAGDSTTGDGFMLGPIDLTVKRGEILFIVGGNGGGKTTLVKLLLGLYSAESGSIFLDGREISHAELGRYRQLFSAVLADFHIFQNLLHCDDDDLYVRATHYIGRLGLTHKVQVRDKAFSSIQLSTGQRKRLALVCAYLDDRPVFVFDEWAADQDPTFKRVFYEELLPEMKARGKAVVVVTHDDLYFGCADRIVKLEDGQLVSTVAGAPS